MSLSASTFQAFRTCTASLSSRSLARPATAISRTRMSRLASRSYSEKATSVPEESKEEGQAGQKVGQDAACSELETKLKAKEAETVDLTSRLRYLQADFLNLQRNAAREKEQTRDFAITRFASDLLETVDVLSIALKSVPQAALTPSTSIPPAPSESDSPDAPTLAHNPLGKNHETYLQELHTGVEMTHRLLVQTLFKYHVKPFDPTGDQFDPNFHEALYQAPIPGKEPGTVIDCQKVGYKIKERVLRAAQVGVAQDTSS
ncbi:GrpE-domain-containing protein [Crassisporium funariophilum]|nr:GrpE-domain-containing protein [Crassisporium funariophilum]